MKKILFLQSHLGIVTYLLAFINVSAVMLVLRHEIARSAFAVERPQSIPAPAIPTQERHHMTLVDIHTVNPVAQLKAGVAVAFV